MARFVCRFLMFFMTLGTGLFVAGIELNWNDESVFPKQGDRKVEVPAKHYDFFSQPNPEVRRPEEPVNPVNRLEVHKTFCSDPKVLPIWNAIRRDREMRELLAYTTQSPDCKDMFEIKYVDLNRDGRKEILARSTTAQFCGAVGNCDFWIFEKGRSGLRILLNGNDYWDITNMGEQVLRSRTNGYSDILLKGHHSVSETSYSTYKFNGRKYVETKCLYELPKERIGDKTTWEFVHCKEIYGGPEP